MSTPFFTQCACALFEQVPPLGDIERALDGWAVAGQQQPATGEDGWLACGPGLVVELRGGGSVIVDVVDREWPDGPHAGADAPALAAAWRAGLFGPCATPGALGRAKAQAWAWGGAEAAAGRHRGFVRLRTVVELPQDGSPRLPVGHDPVHELTTLTEMAGALLRLRGATALFFPGGEAVRSREQVEAVLQRKAGLGPPPVELWLNLRAVGLGEEGGARWLLVDTVGMGQLRLPDQEALFAEGEEGPEAVAPMLRSACLHLLSGKGIPDGSTSDDASGRRWRASAATGVLAPRDRPVVRWLPEGSARPTEALLARLRSP
jgi:hypothetical protein